MIKLDKRILVVIPYLAREAQGRELEYAVAGWRKHFKEKYLIVIVGDYHPVVDTGKDILLIDCPRVGEQPLGTYRPHIDHVNKFRKVREMFPKSLGFVYACDDMYAVNDFSMVEILYPKRESGILWGSDDPSDGWRHDVWKTRELCEREGLPTYNWVCHLPVYYEWDKLLEVYDKYDCYHNSYIVENIYFNIYQNGKTALQLDIDHDNLKCGVYRENPRLNYIDNAFETKIWIQNGVNGWIPYLDARLKAYYGI